MDHDKDSMPVFCIYKFAKKKNSKKEWLQDNTVQRY